MSEVIAGYILQAILKTDTSPDHQCVPGNMAVRRDQTPRIAQAVALLTLL